MNIKAVVVDDEQLAINKISRYLEKLPHIELVESFTNAVQFLTYFKNHPIDLLFLDIQMEDISGIELLEHINNPPKVILTTAYEDYMSKGYEIGVCDYLLKPISFNRFLKAIDKASKEIEISRRAEGIETNTKQQESSKYIYIKSGKQNIKTRLEDIMFIQGMKDYLAVHTKDKRIITLQNFKSILKLLDSNNFLRIHKSYIIALNKIDIINKHSIIIDKKEIPISNMYKSEFNSMMNTLKKGD